MLILNVFLVGAFLSFSAIAASPDYFPLHPGNQWVYRCTGLCGEPLLVTGVSRMDYIAGAWYSVFEGFNGNRAWLRQDESGAVWSLDRASGKEQLWYSYFAPTGQRYETFVHPCSRQASIASRSAPYDGPSGRFPETLQITYPPGACMDAGLSEEIFYRWTGLMRRTETTIAGPRTYDLLYARTGAVTVISQPELHFSLTLDKSVYTANLMPPIDPATSIPKMTARLTLRNTTDKPVTLDFPTGATFCLEITGETDSSFFSSRGCHLSSTLPWQEIVGPGEKDYVIVTQLERIPNEPLRPGRYKATGWLATGSQRAFSASVGFEVRHVY